MGEQALEAREGANATEKHVAHLDAMVAEVRM